jgi:hypothetical protein
VKNKRYIILQMNLEALSVARRRIIDVRVESPLAAEARIIGAYEQSDREAYDVRNRARAEMAELRLRRLHTKVEVTVFPIKHTFDKVVDISARHIEAF